MAEFGIVTRIDGDFADVEIERNEACKHCNACLPSLTGKKMVLHAQNKVNAPLGSAVTVNLTQNGFLSAVALMYVVPVIAFMVVMLVLYYAVGIEWLALLGGLAAVALTYLILHRNEKKLNRDRYTPVVDHILTPEELALPASCQTMKIRG